MAYDGMAAFVRALEARGELMVVERPFGDHTGYDTPTARELFGKERGA